ncbi:MAG: trimethylamine methyltransferase family protein [Deltaproteobacteria bacterium]|nr:trimethylamine methyltransferase family protein [Deltaproteobacteria bacterium]MBW2308089.1 trimethylamine methyltransferase family protein [Deltaproteobacteria bacterium]
MRKENDFSLWQRPQFELLSYEQLTKIYHAALNILERIGGDFYDKEAVELLSDAGAYVIDKKRVRIPCHLVEEALRSAPKRVVISDRNGRSSMFLEGTNIYFGTGSDTPYTLDPYTGERRSAVKEDVVRGALVADYLSEIDFCMCFAIASDVNVMSSDCHHFEAMVRNTTKPLIITSWGLEGLKYMYDMMLAIKGTEENIQSDPFVIFYAEPITPLKHPKESLQKLLFCAEKRIPVLYGPAPTRGATAPVTAAGAFAVGFAEFLSGLVLTQLKRKGSPVICSGGAGAMDMKTCLRPYAAPEQDLSRVVRAEMARFFNLPSWGSGGTSDSKTFDEQAVAEAYQQIFLSSIAGSNLIHDVGYLETGMTSSLELLTTCNELIGKTKQFLKSLIVSEDTLALDVIEEVGPGGNFLTHPHTFEHFKEEIWMPELIDRQNFENWVKAGRKTLKQVVNAKVRWILENHKPERLPEEVENHLREIVEKYDRHCEINKS